MMCPCFVPVLRDRAYNPCLADAEQCLRSDVVPGSRGPNHPGERSWPETLAGTGLWKVREVPQPALDPDFRNKGIRVLQLTRLAAHGS